MSNLVKQVFGSALAPAEQETAIREISMVGDSLERQSKSVQDTIQIAGSLQRVRDEHGHTSAFYQTYLSSVKDVNAGWDDKQYRFRVIRAFDGYQALPGSDQEKSSYLWKLKPSLSALEAVNRIEPSQLYKFYEELKSRDKFPSASEVERFAMGKAIKPKTHSTPTAPQQPQFNQSYSMPSTEDTISTSSELVSCEVVNPLGELPLQQPMVAGGFAIEKAPETDKEKFAKAIELMKSIRDLDSLYADTECLSLAVSAAHELEVVSAMATPVSTRKYV